MLLQGSIHRFNLADVLQFLAADSATGILEVRDFEEYGFVYIVGGRVEGISLPISDEKLGTKLVNAGCLTENQLAQALVEDSLLTREEKKLKPLGQRLIDRGLVAADTIREVIGHQVMDQVFELAHWRNGIFIYEEPEEMPDFQTKIQANVQQLLLDAQRRIDEGEKAHKGAGAVENEVCYMCPEAAHCSPEIKKKYLKNDVCLWRRLTAVADERVQGLADSRELYRSKTDSDASVLNVSLHWD